MSEAPFAPQVFLIGAQKAGTTSLAEALDRHPGIAVSDPKEPQFFTEHWERGFDWYRRCFPAEPPALCVDASTSYSMAPLPDPDTGRRPADSRMAQVPRRIFECRPDARFIYVLRDPVDRALSAYWHATRAGEETRPVREAITARSMYVRGSRYSYQIQCYLEFFEMQAFHFVDFRRLVSAPQVVLPEIFTWLGLTPEGQVELERSNDSYVFSPAAQRMVGMVGGLRGLKRIVGVARHVVPEGTIRFLKQRLTRPVPKTDEEERRHARTLLADEYAAIEALAGVRFE